MMMGSPRMISIMADAVLRSAFIFESRIRARMRPITLLSKKARMVTCMVTTAPLSRIGRKSMALLIESFMLIPPQLNTPLFQYFVQRAIVFDLLDGLVEALFEFVITFSDDQADLTGTFLLVIRHDFHAFQVALLNLVGEDGLITNACLDSAQSHISGEISQGIVGADVLEIPFFL